MIVGAVFILWENLLQFVKKTFISHFLVLDVLFAMLLLHTLPICWISFVYLLLDQLTIHHYILFEVCQCCILRHRRLWQRELPQLLILLCVKSIQTSLSLILPLFIRCCWLFLDELSAFTFEGVINLFGYVVGAFQRLEFLVGLVAMSEGDNLFGGEQGFLVSDERKLYEFGGRVRERLFDGNICLFHMKG